MAKKEPLFTEAIEEISNLIDKIEENELNVDELSEKVKRVEYLMKICRSKLYETEQDVNNILKEMDRPK